MPPVLSKSSTINSGISRQALLCLLFAELDARRLRYCVLHSFENLPEVLTSDLDIAVASGDFPRLSDVLIALEARGYRAVQCLNYAVGGYYFVFAWTEESSVRTVAIDFIAEHREGKLILTSGDELVEGRRRFRDFWIPAASAEYRYLLSKKVLKGVLCAHQARRLAELATELGPAEARAVCIRLFGKRWGARAAAESVKSTFGCILRELRLRLWWQTIVRRPWMPMWYHVTDFPRLLRRLTQPTGFLIAVLGPDGVGKSTLIDKLGTQLEGAFRCREVFHWRPKVLFADKPGPVLRPHAHVNYSVPRSLAHLAGHFADYQLGFALRIRPLLARTGLVLFDRYFYDLAADPKRYRYGGPPAIPRMLFSAVPCPDLVLVLDASETVVLGRKSETSADEIRKERERYGKLAERELPVHRLDASLAPDVVALDACRLVLDSLWSRFKARHKSWVTPSQITVLDQTLTVFGTGSSDVGERRLAVLPSVSNPRWLVPVSSGLKSHKDRFSLYTPYAAKARLMKVALSAGMRLPASIWARETISIPASGALEDLVRQVFGKPSTNFTVSLGTPGRYRKATVQIGVNGRVAGFLKMPLTLEARRRVEHEAMVLARLSTVPNLRPFLPSMLYAGDCDGRFVLLQSPLSGKAGGVRFEKDHSLFLEELAQVEPSTRDAQELLEEIGHKWESVAHLPTATDRRTIAKALRAIEQIYYGLRIPCGYSHGDFAPWNTRYRPKQLGVLDWEAAEFAKPRDWDAFHFQTQTAALLCRDAGCRIDANTPGTNCSYLMYLVHSTCALLDDQGASGKDVTYRIWRLKECL
jgi:thymidylate kinase